MVYKAGDGTRSMDTVTIFGDHELVSLTYELWCLCEIIGSGDMTAVASHVPARKCDHR